MPATIEILISCYNEMQYIEDRMRQILTQTWPADRIVIIDDGSTDGSLELLEGIAARNPIVEVHSNRTNRGGSYTLQRLCELASADYLHFASVDDIMLPEFLEKNMIMLEVYPEAAIGYSPAGYVAEGSQEIRFFPTNWATEPTFFTGPEYAAIAAGIPIGGLPTVIKRECLTEIGGFPEELKWHSDGFIETMLALRYGFCYVPEMLTINRIRATSYSVAGMRDWGQEGPILADLLRHIKSPKFENELPLYSQALVFRVYGPRILWSALGNPEHWDLDTLRLIRPMLQQVLQDDHLIGEYLVDGLKGARVATPLSSTASTGR